jgi:uncharacterized protein (TIGR03086 family)
MDPAESYRRASEWTAAVFARIRPDQMSNSTPCHDWDVRTVVNHVVDSNLRFAKAVRGADPSREPSDGYVGDDVAAAYRASTDEVQAAMETEGATERMFPIPMGELPGTVLYSIAMTEQLLHGWDLAVATSQDTSLDPALVAAADAILRPAVDAGQAGSAYSPPTKVDAGASAQDKLIALVGRGP